MSAERFQEVLAVSQQRSDLVNVAGLGIGPAISCCLMDEEHAKSACPGRCCGFGAAASTEYQGPPSEAEVRAYYDANPSRFPKPAVDPKAPAPAKADPAADYAAVQSQVEAALKSERAQRLAAKAASQPAPGCKARSSARSPVSAPTSTPSGNDAWR